MNKKQLRKNEFRYNNTTKHPNYVFEEFGNKYHSLGITHKEKTFGKKNMPLSDNPDKRKKEKAFIRNGIITDKKKNYSKKNINSMNFSLEDFPKVKSKIRNFKKRQKKSKQRT